MIGPDTDCTCGASSLGIDTCPVHQQDRTEKFVEPTTTDTPWRPNSQENRRFDYPAFPDPIKYAVVKMIREIQSIADGEGEPVLSWGTEDRSTFSRGQIIGLCVKAIETIQRGLIDRAPGPFEKILGGQKETGGPMNRALIDIVIERIRQIEVEGFDAAHDDKHEDGSIADAAACYAHMRKLWTLNALDGGYSLMKWDRVADYLFEAWPRSWHSKWWKPTNRRRNLVKAGALIVAEIERIDRLERRNEEAADQKHYGRMMDGCETEEDRQAMHKYLHGT